MHSPFSCPGLRLMYASKNALNPGSKANVAKGREERWNRAQNLSTIPYGPTKKPMSGVTLHFILHWYKQILFLEHLNVHPSQLI